MTFTSIRRGLLGGVAAVTTTLLTLTACGQIYLQRTRQQDRPTGS